MTAKRGMVFVAALCAAVLFTVRLLADDSAMSRGAGGAVAPMVGHPSVRMVSEKVNIRLTDEDARVRCEFVFKNEGKACVVKMGFPDKGWSSGEGSTGKLSKFRSWVDGKPVKCVYRKGNTVKGQHSDEQRRTSWYVKDVPFAANQSRTVVDEYHSDLGASSSVMMTSYQTPRDFAYILQTGRNWKGPIGRAAITADISKVPTDYDIEWTPASGVLVSHTITWKFASFEPSQDISINLTHPYPKLNDKETQGYQWTPFYRERGVTMTGAEFLQELGADVEYPEKHGVVVIRYGDHALKLVPGSKMATLDGKTITLQAAPSTKHYPVAIPTASVVRALGGRAAYSQKQHRLLVWLKDLSKGDR